MGFSSFFNQIANNFRDHYQQLTDSVSRGKTPNYYSSDKASESKPAEQLPADTYLPSSEAEKPNNSTETNTPKSDTPTYQNPTEPNPNNLPTDSQSGEVGYMKRTTTLDYKMMLQFDLAAIQGVAESIADGDTQEITEFAGGGFGLRAAFDIKSKEIIETNMAQTADGKNISKSNMRSKSRLAGAFGA